MGFETMWFPLMALLLLFNGSFVAMSYLSVSQTNSATLSDTWGANFVFDMNKPIVVFNTQLDKNLGIAQDSNAPTEATTDISIKIDSFKNLLFGTLGAIGGAVGIAFAVLKFFGQILFGYMFWIDYLLVPAWHPLVAAMGLMLKLFFFIVEIIGLSSYAKSFFVFRNLF